MGKCLNSDCTMGFGEVSQQGQVNLGKFVFTRDGRCGLTASTEVDLPQTPDSFFTNSEGSRTPNCQHCVSWKYVGRAHFFPAQNTRMSGRCSWSSVLGGDRRMPSHNCTTRNCAQGLQMPSEVSTEDGPGGSNLRRDIRKKKPNQVYSFEGYRHELSALIRMNQSIEQFYLHLYVYTSGQLSVR